jgi:hypothetical protein
VSVAQLRIIPNPERADQFNGRYGWRRTGVWCALSR